MPTDPLAQPRVVLRIPTRRDGPELIALNRRSRALHRGWTSPSITLPEANIQPGNLVSRTLVVSLGFRLEGYSPRYLKIGGRWRDHESWARLADQ